MIIDKQIKVSQFFFFKPHSFVEMVGCNIVLHVRFTILPLSSICFTSFKVYILQLYFFASATREVGSSDAAA